jgi:hypothetical protein
MYAFLVSAALTGIDWTMAPASDSFAKPPISRVEDE